MLQNLISKITRNNLTHIGAKNSFLFLYNYFGRFYERKNLQRAHNI